MTKRYAYRFRTSGGLVTTDYAAKAPATAYLHGLIERELAKAGDFYPRPPKERKKLIKEAAARDYDLVTYVLVAEPKLESLERSAKWLMYLEDAGVDNWQGYDEARRMQREAEGEDEE